MKVKACGIKYVLPAWADYDEFFTYAAGLNDENIDGDVPKPQRFLRVLNHKGISYGVSIYARDKQTAYRLTRSQRKATELKAVVSPDEAEFCFFVIHHSNGAGLISQYPGCGTTIETLGIFLNRRFRRFKEDKGAEAKGEKKKRPRMPGFGRMSRVNVVESWSSIIKKSQAALVANVSYETPEIVASKYTPDIDIRSTSVSFQFGEKTSKQKVVEWMTNLFQILRPRRASVRILDNQNEETTIQVGPTNAEVFGHWDFDSMKGSVDLKDWRPHPLMAELDGLKNDPRIAKLPR